MVVRQVLPARPLERRADPRGARLRGRTRGGRDPGGAAAGRWPRHAPHAARTRACSARRSRRRSTPARGYRFSVARAPAGRAPELDDAGTLEWIGRFIGRMHAVGATRAVRAPADARRADLRHAPAATGCWRSDFVPPDALTALAQRRRRGARRGARRLRQPPAAAHAAPARRLPPRQHAVERRAARTSSTSTTPSPARRCRTCGCCSRATARAMTRQLARRARGLRGLHGLRLARAAPDRAAAHAAHDPPQRLDRAALERPGLPDRLPVVRRARPTGPSRSTQLREQIEAMAEPPLRQASPPEPTPRRSGRPAAR